MMLQALIATTSSNASITYRGKGAPPQSAAAHGRWRLRKVQGQATARFDDQQIESAIYFPAFTVHNRYNKLLSQKGVLPVARTRASRARYADFDILAEFTARGYADLLS